MELFGSGGIGGGLFCEELLKMILEKFQVRFVCVDKLRRAFDFSVLLCLLGLWRRSRFRVQLEGSLSRASLIS
jgi:hypothetical protein